MDLHLWIYYLLSTMVLTMSPGPTVLLCMTKSVTEGFMSAIYTGLGSLVAIVAIMTLSFTGLGLIIASSDTIFTIVKYAGAIYLIYLGYKALTSTQESYDFTITPTLGKRDKLSSFLKGFTVGATNPKAIVFFTALFPQFINTQNSLLLQYLIFVSTFVTLEVTWLLLYVYLARKSLKWLMAKGRAKIFNRLTGGVFIGAGTLLSTTSRT